MCGLHDDGSDHVADDGAEAEKSDLLRIGRRTGDPVMHMELQSRLSWLWQNSITL